MDPVAACCTAYLLTIAVFGPPPRGLVEAVYQWQPTAADCRRNRINNNDFFTKRKIRVLILCERVPRSWGRPDTNNLYGHWTLEDGWVVKPIPELEERLHD
jgi:hypothetical protein